MVFEARAFAELGAFGIDDERGPDVLVARKAETLGHHADHRHHGSVDAERLPHHVGRALEPLLPHLVADERHRRRAGLVVIVPEIAAKQWGRAQQAKHVAGEGGGRVTLGLAVGPHHVGRLHLQRAIGLERLLAAHELRKGVHPHVHVVLFGDAEGRHVQDAVGFGERQPPQHRPVDDAEHGGSEADAQAQGHDGQQRHPRPVAHGADGKPKVAHGGNYESER